MRLLIIILIRIINIYIDPNVHFEAAVRLLMDEIERTSKELQCEILLLFLSDRGMQKSEVWNNLGYKKSSIQSLGVQTWQEAASESMPPGSTLYFKQLREDRVLRPI